MHGRMIASAQTPTAAIPGSPEWWTATRARWLREHGDPDGSLTRTFDLLIEDADHRETLWS